MEHPILFNTEMVRAILDGRKTQTRRVIKPQPDFSKMRFNGKSWEVYMGYPQGHDVPISPYGLPGDFLWVRETFAEYILDGTTGYWYRATEEDFSPLFLSFGYTWKPSIFMPKRASRIKLLVKNVRIESVQDITEADAMADGVKPVPFASGFNDNELHKAAFFQLWDSINAKRGYPVDSKPFVWVIEFEVVA